MDLTKIELDFLARCGYSKNDVYDASGLKTKFWKILIVKEGKAVALSTPCTNGRHRLKWPTGHCAQCNPINNTFIKIYSETKNIYIAGSLSKQFMKIGISDDPHHRVGVLRSQPYGGVPDWQLLFYIKVPNSGRVERTALSSLKKHIVKLGYAKDGGTQIAIEVVRCSYLTALKAVNNATDSCLSEPWQLPNVQLYEFK